MGLAASSTDFRGLCVGEKSMGLENVGYREGCYPCVCVVVFPCTYVQYMYLYVYFNAHVGNVCVRCVR